MSAAEAGVGNVELDALQSLQNRLGASSSSTNSEG
jgi:hypothetical protein